VAEEPKFADRREAFSSPACCYRVPVLESALEVISQCKYCLKSPSLFYVSFSLACYHRDLVFGPAPVVLSYVDLSAKILHLYRFSSCQGCCYQEKVLKSELSKL
jgi:hypothetical protein